MDKLQMVPVSQLVESKTNPRRHFGESGMAELTESVMAHGVLNALLVRPLGNNGKLEVICGARRCRAAQAGGLEQVPVRVVDLSDDQVLEIQVIENLQREDVHPLDEAEGYRALMKTGRYEVEDLAAKVGKSGSYIYQRLKLCELIDSAKKAFWAQKMTAGQAILVARLQPADQKRLMQVFFGSDREAVSVRHLADWIARELLLDLAKAGFDTKDRDLLSSAPPCVDCSKRTGAQAMLWPEIGARDHCTDPTCFRAKEQAAVDRRLEELIAAGEKPLKVKIGYRYAEERPKDVLESHEYREVAKSKPCAHTRKAVVALGEGVGRVITICADPNCRIHRPGLGDDSARLRAAGHDWKQRQQKDREEKRQRSEILRRARTAATEGLHGIALLETRDWRLIAHGLIRRLEHDKRKLLIKELGIDCPKGQCGGLDVSGGLHTYAAAAGGEELARLLFHLAIAALEPWGDPITDHPDDPGDRYTMALAERGVDLKAIAAEVKAEAEAAAAAKKAARTKARVPKIDPRATTAAHKAEQRANVSNSAVKKPVQTATSTTKGARKCRASKS